MSKVGRRITPTQTGIQWFAGGKFVSDSQESMAGMFVICDEARNFVAAFQWPEDRDRAVCAGNAHGALVEACKKTLTCASLNSDVRALVLAALQLAEGKGE